LNPDGQQEEAEYAILPLRSETNISITNKDFEQLVVVREREIVKDGLYLTLWMWYPVQTGNDAMEILFKIRDKVAAWPERVIRDGTDRNDYLGVVFVVDGQTIQAYVPVEGEERVKIGEQRPVQLTAEAIACFPFWTPEDPVNLDQFIRLP
jgi:hypothetical protein